MRIESGESGAFRLPAVDRAWQAAGARDSCVRDSAACGARRVPDSHNRESCGKGDVFTLGRESGPIPFARFLREANLVALERLANLRPLERADAPEARRAEVDATPPGRVRDAAPTKPEVEVQRVREAYRAPVLSPSGRYIDIWI